ncbi:PREDICTED: scarecrow-like protein 34 [Camelina sativa]|uniref:Scarecrow-like protein 34 n=1 Tax=Camelina sativa TaxID=90675 RepID=A0ABM0WEP0_CAMSA|nr:PREDICTED: scarecrow-like protein 34 [Camelina sativa]XP_010470001.1 PREDICTED: scarecrow-like protein 34 [Camelina sativa]
MMDPNFDANPSFLADPVEEDQYTLLKYVSEILMEESNGDYKQSMFYDSLALRKTEEMLQQVITDSQNQSFSCDSIITTSSSSFAGRDAGGSIVESADLRISPSVVKSMFSDADSALQFKKGVEEASKFLPNSDHWLIKPERCDLGLDPLRVKRSHEREVIDFEEVRNSKQFATNVEDGKITELFDKVLLLDSECDPPTLLDSKIQEIQSNHKQGVKGKKKKKKKKKSQVVDFRTLLTLCAQAISTGDKTTALDLLMQIRQQSSPIGDAGQRLAHCFANALEARLQGSTGSMIQTYYNAITTCSLKETATDTLKAYRVYLSSSPFVTLMYFFSFRMILDASIDAKVLHIVDFGILYGFQWPMFIQYISSRKDAPRKLRITGIELPQRGFRPAERIEETGRRLAEYCKRFNVPFEYKAIAFQHWDKIRIQDLDIRPNEVLAVTAGLRLKNLQDETGSEENCPRDAVLKLIRNMNPNVFIHSIVNGSFNAPFFISRFKEAVYHYSALFDMFDSTLPRDNEERIRFEREFYGREAMNVIACEEADRVERPETYRQWQVRMVRAGFRQKQVKPELVEKFREKLKKWGYHKDFVVDENSKWLLLGWKGRTLYASSCWVPL